MHDEMPREMTSYRWSQWTKEFCKYIVSASDRRRCILPVIGLVIVVFNLLDLLDLFTVFLSSFRC